MEPQSAADGPISGADAIPIILDALNRAATAHGVHEEQLGYRDEEWPQWYAEHMAATLAEDGYQLVRSK
jgi:hypothetical protein